MSPSILASQCEEPLFPSNESILACLSRQDLSRTEIDGGLLYSFSGRPAASGPHVVTNPTGHQIVYAEGGRRVLCFDPSGTILHECEWGGCGGTARLARARVRLDSLFWIGLVPEAVTRSTTVSRTRSGDGQARLPERGQAGCAEEFRAMAAHRWGVSLDDLRYFYPDSSFTQQGNGRLTIQLKKDGLYFLSDGTFTKPTFISYMGAIPWARIDLLNVVELFQSTLPGTGSAMFDLIWGLCMDQRQAMGPIPLRYRGIPTYPSEQAYGLFSAYFCPNAPEGRNPHELFMDQTRANHIAWWPRDDPPWRYVDRTRRLTITVQGGVVQKVTVMDDPVGIPFVAPGTHGGFASCQRTVVTADQRLFLNDGDTVREIAVDPSWRVTEEGIRNHLSEGSDTLLATRSAAVSDPLHGDWLRRPRQCLPPFGRGQTPHADAGKGVCPPERGEGDLTPPRYPYGWRTFFDGHPPSLDPKQVQTLALFYPDDETEVSELATQPFVLEQLYGSLNRLDHLKARLARIHTVLLDGFDAVAAGCFDLDFARWTTVLYRAPAWAQKQAQVLWDQAARAGRLEAVRDTQFLSVEQHRHDVYQKTYDLICCWVPFARYELADSCEEMLAGVSSALVEGGLAFVVGPLELGLSFPRRSLRLLDATDARALERLPLLIEHVRLHPRTRLNQALTVFLVEKAPAWGH